MVISLGPGKFYGTSLPRPRFYTDVKFNDHRVDPPAAVTDPLMSWAQEAHWSMGGLSFKRLRLQGKIEGNVNKLRSQREKLSKAQAQSPLPPARSDTRGSKRPGSASRSPSPPPAPLAAKRRRFLALISGDKEEDKEEEEKEDEGDEEFKVANRGVRRKLVKKLGEEFDRVASESEGSDASDRVGSKSGLLKGSGDGSEYDSMALRTRSRRLVKGGKAVRKVVEEVKKSNPKGKKDNESEGEKSPVSGNGVRTSPRLAKRVFN